MVTTLEMVCTNASGNGAAANSRIDTYRDDRRCWMIWAMCGGWMMIVLCCYGVLGIMRMEQTVREYAIAMGDYVSKAETIGLDFLTHDREERKGDEQFDCFEPRYMQDSCCPGPGV